MKIKLPGYGRFYVIINFSIKGRARGYYNVLFSYAAQYIGYYIEGSYYTLIVAFESDNVTYQACTQDTVGLKLAVVK